MSPPRLLVLDDDAQVCSLLERYFAGLGWAVETCIEPERGRALIDGDGDFDVLICDLHFTDARRAEGFQMIAQTRRRRPRSAVLLFTAAGEGTVSAEAVRLGADAVVPKPSRLADLRDAALRAMKRA